MCIPLTEMFCPAANIPAAFPLSQFVMCPGLWVMGMVRVCVGDCGQSIVDIVGVGPVFAAMFQVSVDGIADEHDQVLDSNPSAIGH